MLSEAAGYPIFGEGLGTRITGFRNTFRNAPILDNQWLNTILELGYVGAAFWLWLFVRSVRRLCRASRESEDGDDWLFAGLAASITGFGVGMLTFDAFRFTQITFVFWILLGLSAAMLRINEEMRAEVRELAPRLRPAHEETSSRPWRGRADQRDAFRSSAPALRGVWRRSPSKSVRIRESELLLERPGEAQREVEIDLCVVRVRVACAPFAFAPHARAAIVTFESKKAPLVQFE